MKKDVRKKYMFQYATKHKILENTELITLDEALALWNKWQGHILENWDDWNSPQMVIWMDCDSNTDYHTELAEIDYRDCELEGGRFYRIEKTLIDPRFNIKLL